MGDSPNVMWSSHTDTVHHDEGLQDLIVDGPWIKAVTGKKRELTNCLGADCTTGVWLMIKMIEAKVPGLYIFHREEEVGGRGSQWIADNRADDLAGIQFAIALDRMDYGSVITHQGMSRCCSDEFAEGLSYLLGDNFKPDDGGIFTDTANYTKIIPECTNLSVGYFNQHGPNETQNWMFANNLLEKLTSIDLSGLIPIRDPSEVDDEPWWINYGKKTYSDENEYIDLDEFCFRHPVYVARWLEKHKVDVEELIEFRKKEREKDRDRWA